MVKRRPLANQPDCHDRPCAAAVHKIGPSATDPSWHAGAVAWQRGLLTSGLQRAQDLYRYRPVLPTFLLAHKLCCTRLRPLPGPEEAIGRSTASRSVARTQADLTEAFKTNL